MYEIIRGSNLLLLFLPLLLGVLVRLLYTIVVIRPPMTLRAWSFRRLIYEVLCFGCVIASAVTASAWLNIRIVAMPLCVAVLLMLLCESGIVVYECIYNKGVWRRDRGRGRGRGRDRGRGAATTHDNTFELALDEEELLGDE